MRITENIWKIQEKLMMYRKIQRFEKNLNMNIRNLKIFASFSPKCLKNQVAHMIIDFLALLPSAPFLLIY